MIQSVWKNLTGLIPAEHLWCDFKWAKNSSPNTICFINLFKLSVHTLKSGILGEVYCYETNEWANYIIEYFMYSRCKM